MGQEQRIKGQEAEIRIVENGRIVSEMADTKDFEVAFLLDKSSEGYLGEKTDRKDEVYTGVRGKVTVHFEDGNVFDFFKKIIDRAKRKIKGLRINITAILSFPDGSTRSIVIADCYFGEIPMTIGGRTDFISVALDFESSDFELMG